jgi:hypothetical protein
MRIVGIYSFNNGREVIESRFGNELQEVEQVIAAVDSRMHKTKTSKEKTMRGRMLYKPGSLNTAFKEQFASHHWHKYKVDCEYPSDFYAEGYKPIGSSKGAFREMDYVKNRVGVEVQFGKYAFMVYNVAAKMTIFHNLDIIDVGIEIVPVKDFADDMSTGVSYFEQFVWDLEHRGVSNIDIPVLVLGISL